MTIMANLTQFLEDNILNRKFRKQRLFTGYEWRCGYYDWSIVFLQDRIHLTRKSTRFSHHVIFQISGDKIVSYIVRRYAFSKGTHAGSVQTMGVTFSKDMEAIIAEHISCLDHRVLPTYTAGKIFTRTRSGEKLTIDLLSLDELTNAKMDAFLSHYGLGFLSPSWDYGVLKQETVELAHRMAVRQPTMGFKRVGAEVKRLVNLGVLKTEPVVHNNVQVVPGHLYEEYLKAAMSLDTFEHAVARMDAMQRVGIWNYQY